MNLNDNQLFLILNAIQESKVPIGSGRLLEKLKKNGFNISLSTMGRILEEIDDDGYIKKDGYKGRVITKLGEEKLSELQFIKETNIVQTELMELINKTGKVGMLNYLHARKAIESEAIRLAVETITDEEIESLASILAKELRTLRDQNLDATNDKIIQSQGELDYKFHHAIIKASKNPYFDTFYRLLEASGKMQEMYFFIVGQSIEDHIIIFECIKERNGKEAILSLRNHLDNVISKCESYWKNRELVEKYLKDKLSLIV